MSIAVASQQLNAPTYDPAPEDYHDPSFMYARLVREVLVSMDTSSNDIRRELVVECSKRYFNDDLQLTYVDELDIEYDAGKAIWWYTRPTFMYQELNRALLKQDIKMLYKMRFFIKDLNLQLTKLHHLYVQTLSSDSITVYRGLSLPNDIFKGIQSNCGGLIAFNTFLSTSTERKVALSFAMQKLRHPGIQSILFEMEIVVAKCLSPFADIQEWSEMRSEKEILFSMGTVFCIHRMSQLSNGVWTIHLALHGDEDIQLRQLTEHMREELQGSHPLFTLGRLMKTLGQYENAEHYYHILINERESFANNATERAKLFSDLGGISMDKRLHSQALEYFQQSLQCDPNSAECHANMGLVYQELQQHDQALKHLHRAIELGKITVVSSRKAATQFNNIGIVYHKLNRFDLAKQNYEQALKLRMECLPPTHSDIAQSHSNIGAISYAQKDYVTALSSFTTALEIKSLSLPCDHPSLAITLNNIARTLFNQGLYHEALSNATKAVAISTKALGENHPQTRDLAASLQSMQRRISEHKST